MDDAKKELKRIIFSDSNLVKTKYLVDYKAMTKIVKNQKDADFSQLNCAFIANSMETMK